MGREAPGGEKDRWNNHGQRDDSYYNDFSPRDAEGTWQALGGIDIAIVLTRGTQGKILRYNSLG